MKDEAKAQFNRTIHKNRESLRVYIPPELADHLELDKDSEIKMQAEHGPHGPYFSVWNPEQQQEEEQ